MVLSCFVFYLSKNPKVYELDHKEIASLHWIPISYLTSSQTSWKSVYFPITNQILSRRLQKFKFLKGALDFLLGGFSYYGIPVPANNIQENRAYFFGHIASSSLAADDFPIWGLTLWMTIDFLCLIHEHPETFRYRTESQIGPRYSSPDIEIMVKAFSLNAPMSSFLTRSRVGILNILNLIRFASLISLSSKIYIFYVICKKTIKWSTGYLGLDGMPSFSSQLNPYGLNEKHSERHPFCQ